MNKISIDAKVEVMEVNEEKGFFYINGFLIEEKQKMKFIFKTQEQDNVFKMQNLDEEKTYHITGDVFVKYKKHVYTSVNVQNIADRENGTILIE